MRKSVSIKLLSAVVLFVYMAAVIGFDVHSCGDNGEVYVESLLCDISCQALHPDTPCHHVHHCCDCPEGCQCGDCCDCCGCDDGEDCCSDCIEVLTLAGMDQHGIVLVAPVATAVLTPAPADVLLPSLRFGLDQHSLLPRPPGDILSQICVLRV